MEERREKLKALDGVRGLAVLLVFMSHSSGRGMSFGLWANFHGIGHIGVYLFFVLSGFLLTKNLLQGQNALQFYVRRFFRIAPLYYLILLGVIVSQAAGYTDPQYLFIKNLSYGVLTHFLFIKGDGIFWSISAEFLFYFLLPLVLITIKRFGHKWLVVFSMAYFVWYVLALVYDYFPPLKFVIIEHNSQFLDVFSCGILGAILEKRLPEKLVAIAFWGLLLVSLIFISKNFMGAGQPCYSLRWASILYGVVFALGIVSASQGNIWIAFPLQSNILVFMGITGFSWYLIHLPVLQIVNEYFTGFPSSFRLIFSGLAISILAFAAYKLIELPGIRFGRKVENYLMKIQKVYKVN